MGIKFQRSFDCLTKMYNVCPYLPIDIVWESLYFCIWKMARVNFECRCKNASKKVLGISSIENCIIIKKLYND